MIPLPRKSPAAVPASTNIPTVLYLGTLLLQMPSPQIQTADNVHRPLRPVVLSWLSDKYSVRNIPEISYAGQRYNVDDSVRKSYRIECPIYITPHPS